MMQVYHYGESHNYGHGADKHENINQHELLFQRIIIGSSGTPKGCNSIPQTVATWMTGASMHSTAEQHPNNEKAKIMQNKC